MKEMHLYFPPALQAVPAVPSSLLTPSARWALAQMAVQSWLPTAASCGGHEQALLLVFEGFLPLPSGSKGGHWVWLLTE